MKLRMTRIQGGLKRCLRPTVVILALILVPGALLIFLGLTKGAVPILIYFQLLLIWIQLEINQRQNRLFSAQFRPFFSVELKKPVTGELKIKNISKSPVYNLSATRVFEGNNPLRPSEWRGNLINESARFQTLAPGEEIGLKLFASMEAVHTFKRRSLQLEFSYWNQFGEFLTFRISFFENTDDLLLLPAAEEKPGLLINELERVTLVYKYFRYVRPLTKHHTLPR